MVDVDRAIGTLEEEMCVQGAKMEGAVGAVAACQNCSLWSHSTPGGLPSLIVTSPLTRVAGGRRTQHLV